MIDFGEIKRTITPIEAARRYGTVKHGFMRCPFHADRTPSLKLYDNHFHCFGCGAHGDVIDLAAGLLGCSKSEAARRLVADFGCGRLVPPLGLRPASASSRAAGRCSHRSRRMRRCARTTAKPACSRRGQAICST